MITVNETDFLKSNNELLHLIADTTQNYRTRNDYNSLLMLAHTLNQAALAIMQVCEHEGFYTKELTVDDVLKRNH